MYEELKKLRLLTEALVSADEKLEKNLRDWEYALNSMPNLIFIVDKDMRIKFVNQTMCDVFGYNKDNFKDRFCHDIIANKCELEECNCICNRNPESTVSLELDDVYLQPIDKWYSHSRSPIFHNGVLIGHICVMTDITERKIYEEELIRKDNMLRGIFKSVPSGIGVINMDRVILWVNNKIEEMLGYSKHELEGKSARVLYPSKEEFERVGKEKFAQIAISGTGTLETKWKKKDGSLIDVLLTTTALDNENRATFSAQDITNVKSMERALECIKD